MIQDHNGDASPVQMNLSEDRTSRLDLGQKHISNIGWLSTSIVHDLRNPLGAIYAAAEMLIDLDPGLTQVQRLATVIFRAAGRMRELVADLNRIRLGTTPTPEMCDIREVVAAATDAACAEENGRVQILLECQRESSCR